MGLDVDVGCRSGEGRHRLDLHRHRETGRVPVLTDPLSLGFVLRHGIPRVWVSDVLQNSIQDENPWQRQKGKS